MRVRLYLYLPILFRLNAPFLHSVIFPYAYPFYCPYYQLWLLIQYAAINTIPYFVVSACGVGCSSDSFRLFGGGTNDVYKEAQEYICADAGAHSLRPACLVI
ncbi:hypothetical protein Holit_01359 [Hollandina sp. SP2]